nr:SMC-Scp complex subunit ScpB [Leisingera daeponensis]
MRRIEAARLHPAIRAAADAGGQGLDLSEFDVAVLAAIAYHQPVTRDGLKEIFGKEISRDLTGRLHARGLIATGPRSPRRGAPYTFVTTGQFLAAFGLESLSDPSKVSAETLRKINEAIAATGFVPDAIAGALASSRSKLITALVPSITNVVYSAMIRAFSNRMRDDGYQILLSETGFDPVDEEKAIAAHLSRRPDAILLTGIHHSPRSRQMLLASGIPVVEVWDYTETPIDCCVGFRHVDTGHAAAEFAAENGHLQAATICAGDERDPPEERLCRAV